MKWKKYVTIPLLTSRDISKKIYFYLKILKFLLCRQDTAKNILQKKFSLTCTKLLTTQRASCKLLLASATNIWLPPRTKMVTARELEQCSMTSILSLVVPKDISLTRPAWPNFSGLNSSNLGTMRPPVAMAMSSISGPPT